MDFQDSVRHRRMVRQFTAQPVPRRSLDRILANAVRGPSAGFCQGQAFLVLSGDDLPRFWAIAGEATRPAVHAPPVIIIPLFCQRIYIDEYVRRDPSWADPSRWPMPWWHLDTAMAALLILLTVGGRRPGGGLLRDRGPRNPGPANRVRNPRRQPAHRRHRDRARRRNRTGQPRRPAPTPRRDDPLRPVVTRPGLRSGDGPPSVRARPSGLKRDCDRRTTSTGEWCLVSAHAKSRLTAETCGHSGQRTRARAEPARTGRASSPAQCGRSQAGPEQDRAHP